MTEEHNTQELEKPTISDTVDKFFAGEEKPQEGTPEVQETEGEPGSPETDQPEETPEAGSDPEKTESREESTDFEGVPKGFAEHPAWKKIIQQKQEAQTRLKELERVAKEREDLLNDPQVYRRFLEKQGHSENRIQEMMREKGFVIPESPKPDKDTLVEICDKLGWDTQSLNQDQIAYLKDQVKLIEAAAERLVEKKLASRLEKVESRFQEIDTKDLMRQEYESVVKEAKEEFPDLNWEKDIHPLLTNYLDELDKRDPNKKERLDFKTLYERATRQLLRERRVATERQEERNHLKKNARPLQPGAKPVIETKSVKGKTVGETVDNLWAQMGFGD